MSIDKDRLVACISSAIHREEGFLDYRFIVKSVLDKFDIKVTRNYEDVQTQHNFEAVLREECNLFILLLGDVISRLVAKELAIALARGLPILVFIRVRRDKLGNVVDPIAARTLLYKFCPELYEADRVYFETSEDLAKKVEYQTQNFMNQKLTVAPIIGLDPPVAYIEGIRLIQNAKHRIVLAQRSSSFLLGPRIGQEPERHFYEALMQWLGTKGKQRVFIHYFSWNDTQAAIRSDEYDIHNAKKRAYKLLKRKDGGGLQMVFRASKSMDIVSHVVGDTGLGLNFWIGKKRYYLFLPCFMTKDKELEQIIAGVQNTGERLATSKVAQLYDGRPL